MSSDQYIYPACFYDITTQKARKARFGVTSVSLLAGLVIAATTDLVSGGAWLYQAIQESWFELEFMLHERLHQLFE